MQSCPTRPCVWHSGHMYTVGNVEMGMDIQRVLHNSTYGARWVGHLMSWLLADGDSISFKENEFIVRNS